MKRLLKRMFIWAVDLFPYVSGAHVITGPKIELKNPDEVIHLEVGMQIVSVNRRTGGFATGYIDYSKKAPWETK